jgi:Luciferase-like monooxygenase
MGVTDDSTLREDAFMAGTYDKLDFGFGVFPFSYVSFAEMAELAKLGDALGYYAFTLPEHLLTPNWSQAPISTKFWYDTMVIGSYIAAITTKIKLFTSVSVVPYHPPLQMAKALATFGRHQDIAVQKARNDVDLRNHMRLWRAP